MRERRLRISLSIVATIGLLVGLFGLVRVAFAANSFNVTNTGTTAYLIDGISNEHLTLNRGQTYTFNINVTGHPFWIVTATGAANVTTNAFNTGVTGNGTGQSATGTVTFAVPAAAPATLFYQCGNHDPMNGMLTIVTPSVPAASTFAIVGLALLLAIAAFMMLRRRRENQGTIA
jgi:LPXTG-motif cell wall-anchored protein